MIVSSGNDVNRFSTAAGSATQRILLAIVWLLLMAALGWWLHTHPGLSAATYAALAALTAVGVVAVGLLHMQSKLRAMRGIEASLHARLAEVDGSHRRSHELLAGNLYAESQALWSALMRVEGNQQASYAHSLQGAAELRGELQAALGRLGSAASEAGAGSRPGSGDALQSWVSDNLNAEAAALWDGLQLLGQRYKAGLAALQTDLQQLRGELALLVDEAGDSGQPPPVEAEAGGDKGSEQNLIAESQALWQALKRTDDRRVAAVTELQRKVGALRSELLQALDQAAAPGPVESGPGIELLTEASDNLKAESSALWTALNRIDAQRKAAVAEFQRVEAELRGSIATATTHGEALTTELSGLEESRQRLHGLEQTLAWYEEQHKQQQAQMDGYGLRLGHLEEAVESGTVGASDLRQEFAGLGLSLDKLDQRLQQGGAGGGRHQQVVSHHLSEDDRQTLTETWARKLGLRIGSDELDYLAHRIRSIEAAGVGRLPASVQTMLLRTLCARSLPKKRIRVLEIGTLFGFGAAAIVDGNRGYFEDIAITLVDPLNGYHGSGQPDPVTGAMPVESALHSNLAGLGLGADQVRLIKNAATSFDARQALEGERFDLLVIADDLSTLGVSTAFDWYAPLLDHRGLILFDGYGDDDTPAVQRFVDDEVALLPQLTEVGIDYRTAVFRVSEPLSLASDDGKQAPQLKATAARLHKK